MDTVPSELSALIQVMLLNELRAMRHDGTQQVLTKLDNLTELVGKSHQSEMANIDSEAKALRKQIAEIASNPDTAEQVKQLQALAVALGGIAA